jgi:pimeloyl-ACP methyl ester carboxylesterase
MADWRILERAGVRLAVHDFGAKVPQRSSSTASPATPRNGRRPPQREDGLWPRFDVDVMARTLREADRRSYWQEWDRIRCPVLVVRGANGTIPPAGAQAMIARSHRRGTSSSPARRTTCTSTSRQRGGRP